MNLFLALLSPVQKTVRSKAVCRGSDVWAVSPEEPSVWRGRSTPVACARQPLGPTPGPPQLACERLNEQSPRPAIHWLTAASWMVLGGSASILGGVTCGVAAATWASATPVGWRRWGRRCTRGGRRPFRPLEPEPPLHRRTISDDPVSRDSVDVVSVSGPIRGTLSTVQDMDLLAVGRGVDAGRLIDAGVGVELCHGYLPSFGCSELTKRASELFCCQPLVPPWKGSFGIQTG